MRLFTKITFVAVACALIVGTFAIIGPKTVRAAVATLVQVVNTSSNPVPGADVEKLARIPYESTAGPANCPAPGTAGVCFFNFSDVPSGYRLVAENFAGYFQVSPTATAMLTGYVEDASFRVKDAFSAPLGQVDNGGHIQAAFSHPTRYYVDPGESVFAVASSIWSNGNSEMILSGYLENCSITGCPAVQH